MLQPYDGTLLFTLICVSNAVLLLSLCPWKPCFSALPGDSVLVQAVLPMPTPKIGSNLESMCITETCLQIWKSHQRQSSTYILVLYVLILVPTTFVLSRQIFIILVPRLNIFAVFVFYILFDGILHPEMNVMAIPGQLLLLQPMKLFANLKETKVLPLLYNASDRINRSINMCNSNQVVLIFRIVWHFCASPLWCCSLYSLVQDNGEKEG